MGLKDKANASKQQRETAGLPYHFVLYTGAVCFEAELAHGFIALCPAPDEDTPCPKVAELPRKPSYFSPKGTVAKRLTPGAVYRFPCDDTSMVFPKYPPRFGQATEALTAELEVAHRAALTEFHRVTSGKKLRDDPYAIRALAPWRAAYERARTKAEKRAILTDVILSITTNDWM